MSNPGPASTSTSVVGFGKGEDVVLGNDASSLIGFYGEAGAVQGAALVLVGTSIPVAACASFGLTSTQLTAIITICNAMAAQMTAMGQTA